MTEAFLIQDLKGHFKNRDVFTRTELYEFFLRFNPELKETTFRWRIYDLKQKQIIRSISKARFTLHYQPTFIPFVEPKLKTLFKTVKKNFPYTKISVWNTKWLNEFMLHQPGRFMTILEVESEAASSVFNSLKDSNYKNVFFEPKKKEIENYLSDNQDSIVILNLITKAPTYTVDKITTASLEKILVDVFVNPELYNAFQGHELTIIFENAFKKYEVNETRLFYYASRRSKKEELEKFLLTNSLLPSQI